ncbi:hypothetical protein SeMB42_g01495 [Synchytrium endobioticum]|uniref:SURP motif domain-containing protein n=1 Tax=Synchytrium endobioticum TaxID=286115 RepID=A0A507DMA8_9FUNG|nr:hypothetical protein SeMB42_g01495 [Synchytrium endobioticum]
MRAAGTTQLRAHHTYRYDVRHLIDDEDDLAPAFVPLSPAARDEEHRADAERWKDLPDPRGNDPVPDPPDPEIPPPPGSPPVVVQPPPPPPDPSTVVCLRIPPKPNMIAPPTQREADIIEKTAHVIHDSRNPQLEIVIRTRQTGRPEFGFMEPGHFLHDYYLHVKNVMADASSSDAEKGGGEDQGCEDAPKPVQNEDTEDVDAEPHSESIDSNQPQNAHPQHASDPLMTNDPAVLDVLEKTAHAVAKNLVSGGDLETTIKQRNIGDARFAFLNPWSLLYTVYTARRNQLRDYYTLLQQHHHDHHQ